jgi:tRNA threonylcarbamoyladenosine biosynthesis protein TsaB
MASILCIETATTNCSIALSVNGSVAVLVEDNSKQFSHAERLHTFIEQILVDAKISKNSLDAVAVSKGPGSYTGLRIGVSAAKGLCFALDIPLISIPTLESLALQVKPNTGTIISMLDARRMEVYSAIFSSEGNQIRETQAEILTETSFTNLLEEGPVLFIGTGVEKFEPICQHENATFFNDKLPSAYQMAALAEAKYKISDIENVAYFEPYYLKDFLTTVPKK